MVKQTLHMRFQSRKFLTVTEMWYRCVSGDIFCNVLVISHKIHKEQLVSHVLLDNTKIPSWTKQPLKNKKYFRFNTSVFRKQDCQCKHHVFQATQYISGVFYMKAGKSTLQPYKTAAFELTGSHPAEVRLLVPKKKKMERGSQEMSGQAGHVYRWLSAVRMNWTFAMSISNSITWKPEEKRSYYFQFISFQFVFLRLTWILANCESIAAPKLPRACDE